MAWVFWRIGGRLQTSGIQNGVLVIGDWTGSSGNTADVYLGNESKIIIQQNGLLQISNSSKLIIQSGAEVIIESGGLLDCRWNAQVIVEAGGILRVENNGQLRPGFNSQVWIQPGGQLILDNGAKVQLWNGTVQDADCNIKLGGPIIDPDNTPDVAELVILNTFKLQLIDNTATQTC